MNALADLHVAPPKKAQQILRGAGDAFLEHGFEGASTDEIAKRAGVSKATVYKYFPDKRSLFAAYVREACRVHSTRVFEIDEKATLEESLQHIAQNFSRLLVGEEPMAVFRLVSAERLRFPELAQAFFESGPCLGTERVQSVLESARTRGELEFDDAHLTACQFLELCSADIFLRALFSSGPPPSEEEVTHVADSAVRVFLRAFQPR